MKFLSINTIKIIAAFVFVAFIFGCASNRNKDKKDVVEVEFFDIERDIFEEIDQAKKIFYSLPSPLETAMLIKTAGAYYDEELLNPVENASRYTTNKSMALNLGIYTCDLSFASLFDQTQASISYMSAAKKMADGLGILEAIDNEVIERLEENVNNRDVIMDIISETFMTSSSFLADNQRPAIAAIILVGGWIEGLYIAVELIGDSSIENNKLVGRVVDQKLSLGIVIRLLEENMENEDVVYLMGLINELKEIFDKIQISSSKIETVVDEETNVTTLKSVSKDNLTRDVFQELSEKIKAIRSNFVS